MVNTGNTKIMRCGVGSGAVEEKGEYPCVYIKKGWETILYCVQSVINGYTKDAVRKDLNNCRFSVSQMLWSCKEGHEESSVK